MDNKSHSGQELGQAVHMAAGPPASQEECSTQDLVSSNELPDKGLQSPTGGPSGPFSVAIMVPQAGRIYKENDVFLKV